MENFNKRKNKKKKKLPEASHGGNISISLIFKDRTFNININIFTLIKEILKNISFDRGVPRWRRQNFYFLYF